MFLPSNKKTLVAGFTFLIFYSGITCTDFQDHFVKKSLIFYIFFLYLYIFPADISLLIRHVLLNVLKRSRHRKCCIFLTIIGLSYVVSGSVNEIGCTSLTSE